MTGRLDKGQIDRLKAILGRCRSELTKDLGNLLEGRFGIRRDGTIEPASRLRLDEAGLDTRQELNGILAHFAAEADGAREARERLLREAVFTHLNRLLAIRIAEALGLLPESIGRGRDSAGLRDLLADVAPQLGADETGGYWDYLRLCGDELAADAPVLFDPRNPLLALAPSPLALEQVVAQLAPAYEDPDGESLWLASDALGWAYQFFNTDEERREMREETAPRSSRELAVRNQFFTPDYVVAYLVHNTLGRRLVEADPGSGLAGDLDWLVDPPTSPGEPLDLEDVHVLDPACGSGHFLLGAYDVLEGAWTRRGVKPSEAAARILPALWGIDIDPRAVQVAAAALVLRARRGAGRTAALPRPNVVCARGLPPIPKTLEAALARDRRHLLAELRSELERAPLLGSLLKVEEVLSTRRVAGTSRGVYRRMEPLSVIEDGTEEEAGLRSEVLDLVQRAADAATSTAPERLTAAEAGDALRFVQALSQRYDAVLMNPPFGEPVAGTRPYIKAAYPWIPTKDHNLLAAFVGRGLELCNDHGYVGAITSRAGMFLTTFQAWRTQVLLGHRMVTLADLGFGVMEDALVEAAAYVLGPEPPDPTARATFFRLLRTPAATRPAALGAAIAAVRTGRDDERVFRVDEGAFDAIPGKPLAYWMPPSIRRLFTDLPPLEGHGAEVRQGMATGDDFRFVRAFWEVDARRIARSREETLRGKRWVPFAKGGEYSPYWADIHLVVEFERDGERIRQYEGSVIRNPRYYFRPGITYPARTASGFSPRVMPAGSAFGHKGPAIMPMVDRATLLAWVASRVATAMLAVQLGAGDETSSGTASKSYEVGTVGRLSWPERLGAIEAWGKTALEIASMVRADDGGDETTRSFVAVAAPGGAAIREAAEHGVRRHEDAALGVVEHSASIEDLILDVIGRDAAVFVDEEMGPHPARLPRGSPAGLAEALPLTIETLITRGVEARGGLRSLTQKTYVADRRLEVIAHTYGVHPEVVVQERRRLGILPPGAEREAAEHVFSYLLGCAFGRWDVGIGRDPALAPRLGDLFDPPGLCPPGMLVGRDGFPTDDPGPAYPLRIPPNGLLLDESAHRWDVVAAMEAAAGALVDDPSSLLHELSGILGHDLREHLRRQFFRDHLGRYTKSRRKAPIYWPLTLPSRSWGVWVYAPRLTRETLFAVEAAADQRLGTATIEIRRLESQLLEGSGRTSRELVRRLEVERKLAEELRLFHREAGRIAGLVWTPDPDDGIVLCAAPLADLFPDWAAELTVRRQELKRGKYPWATVSRYQEAL